jgi:hypothetical protein
MNAQGWFPTLICDFESQTHEQFKTSFYNKLEKQQRISELKLKAVQLKKDVEYYNAMQTALKLVD